MAHYLKERAKNGPDTPIPDSDEATRLPELRAYLADPSSKVCPSCIQRGKIFKRLMMEAKPYWGQVG